MSDPYYQETTLAELNKVVKDLGWDLEAVYISGRISYPYPPINKKESIVNQFWLLELTQEGIRRLYFCNAIGRESAKRKASKFLGGDSDQYIVTPITNIGEVVRLQIDIEMSD